VTVATALVTGASRGIGLAITRQYAAAGWRVLATCRSPEIAAPLQELGRTHPGKVELLRLDVEDHDRIRELSSLLKDERLDLLVNNAAWAPRGETLESARPASWEKAMRVNAFATLAMAQAFVEHVARSDKKTIVTIGSQIGSIAETQGGGKYAYRASKAAVNMVVKTLALDLSPRGIVVACLHPGWVKTALGGPDAPLSPEESARALMAQIDRLTPAASGRFFDIDGREIPW